MAHVAQADAMHNVGAVFPHVSASAPRGVVNRRIRQLIDFVATSDDNVTLLECFLICFHIYNVRQLKAKVKLIRNFIYVNQLNIKGICILFAQDAIEMRLTRRRAHTWKTTFDQVKDCNVDVPRPLPNFYSFCFIHTNNIKGKPAKVKLFAN